MDFLIITHEIDADLDGRGRILTEELARGVAEVMTA